MKKVQKRVSLPVRQEQPVAIIPGFDEIQTPEVDVVSLGSASYTKMLGKTYQ